MFCSETFDLGQKLDYLGERVRETDRDRERLRHTERQIERLFFLHFPCFAIKVGQDGGESDEGSVGEGGIKE